MDYPKALKKYREKYFLTQNELAKKLGVSYISINRWENNKFKPTIKVKKKLHALFVDAGIVKGDKK